MAFLFEKLSVYQKAVDVAEKISRLTDSFPKGNYYLSDQLNRASLSISANLAEGNGRFHKNDRKQFFWIARGSVQECVPLLEIAKRKNLIPEQEHLKIKEELEVIAKMISGLVNSI
jgi:four helix bundle protein